MEERQRFHTANVPGARKLRQRMTRSETLLWSRLRGRQFDGLKFRRQHPVGAFVLDFYCDDWKVGLEVDGGIHECPEVARRDRERQEALEEAGIRFVRMPASLDIEAALSWLRTAMHKAIS